MKSFLTSSDAVGLSQHACPGHHFNPMIQKSFWGVQLGPEGLAGCVIKCWLAGC